MEIIGMLSVTVTYLAEVNLFCMDRSLHVIYADVIT